MPLGQHLSTEAFDARKRRFSCRARLVAAFVRKAVLFAPDGEARRCRAPKNQDVPPTVRPSMRTVGMPTPTRSEEHTSELQSLMRISYAVFCLKKNKTEKAQPTT